MQCGIGGGDTDSQLHTLESAEHSSCAPASTHQISKQRPENSV